MSDADNDYENGLDDTAADQSEVYSASISRMTGEFDKLKAAEKQKSKAEWKANPVRSFFKKVALPSALLGAAAYGLSVAHGTPNPELAAMSGALWYPIHSVRKPVASFLGKCDGYVRNLASTFNKKSQETYFQQKTQEIRYEGWSDGAATVALLTGAIMLPTYGELVADTAVTSAKAVGYVANVVTEGVKAVGSQTPTP